MNKNNLFNKFNLNNKFFISILISLFVIFTLFLLKGNFFGGFFSRINLNFQNDLYSQKYSNNLYPNKAITIVEIDNKTLSDHDKGGLGRWQDFKRRYYAKVIDNLKKDGAIVIGIDVLFSEKQNKIDDELLLNSIKNTGNIILAFQAVSSIYPLDSFLENSLIGDIWPVANKYNNMIYSIKPYYNYNQKLIESFFIKILDKYYSTIYGNNFSISKEDIENKEFINFYGIKIPYKKNDYEFLINYVPDNSLYSRISFVDAYNGNYNKELVKDKIILIGATALGLHDEFNTPIGIMPGVYTHANAVNTVLNKKIIFYLDKDTEFFSLIIFVFLITLLGVYDKHKYYFITSLFILIIAFLKVYQFIYTEYNTIFSLPVYFFIAIILSFIFVNLYRFIYEDKGKRILKNALSQYLAKDLVDIVLNDYKKINLDGEKKDIVMFFSDIQGFTTLSENLSPHDLMDFLKKYLKEVSDIIINNKGFINKYEGDAVMALWGTFSNDNIKSYNACKAALDQQKAIDHMNDLIKEKYGFSLFVRMGINKGDAIVGNIGSLGNKIEYTAIGDNVNLASRLESINKYYNTKICVSESVVLDIKGLLVNESRDIFIFRKMDRIKVKGKKNSVTIYELVGYKNEISSEKLDLIKKFEEALSFYFEKDFEKALSVFEKLSSLGDEVSDVFIKRCQYFILNPDSVKDTDWEFSDK